MDGLFVTFFGFDGMNIALFLFCINGYKNDCKKVIDGGKRS